MAWYRILCNAMQVVNQLHWRSRQSKQMIQISLQSILISTFVRKSNFQFLKKNEQNNKNDSLKFWRNILLKRPHFNVKSLAYNCSKTIKFVTAALITFKSACYFTQHWSVLTGSFDLLHSESTSPVSGSGTHGPGIGVSASGGGGGGG